MESTGFLHKKSLDFLRTVATVQMRLKELQGFASI
jgi:hypothetical protein